MKAWDSRVGQYPSIRRCERPPKLSTGPPHIFRVKNKYLCLMIKYCLLFRKKFLSREEMTFLGNNHQVPVPIACPAYYIKQQPRILQSTAPKIGQLWLQPKHNNLLGETKLKSEKQLWKVPSQMELDSEEGDSNQKWRWLLCSLLANLLGM